MSAASPNPMNFLLVGGLALAAVWLISRNGAAQAAAQDSASENIRNASYANALANVAGGLFRGYGSSSSGWSTGGGAWNNPSAYSAGVSTGPYGSYADSPFQAYDL